MSGVTANRIVPQPEAGIKALFDAYNDVQKFIAEKTASGESLARNADLSRLGSELSQAVIGVFASPDLASAISGGSTSREITVNGTALSNQVKSKAESIASHFEGQGGIAQKVRDLAETYSGPSGVVGRLIANRKSQSAKLDAPIAVLTERAQTEESKAQKVLSELAKRILAASRQKSFIGSLGR